MSKKKIDTLIPDILKVVSEGKKVDPKHLEEFTKDCLEGLLPALEEGCNPRKPTVRMSGLGTPNRKLWYSFHSTEKQKPLSAQNAISFMYGHIVEAFILLLVKHAGHEVTRQQEEVTLKGVKGHIDCFIDGVLTDVKSASSYGMNKFKTESILRGDDPYGYIDQISGYAQALSQIMAAFLAVDKSNGFLSLVKLDEFDLKNSGERIQEVRKVISSKTPPKKKCHLPVGQGITKAKPEGNGNLELAKPCTWCDFKEECWSDANDGQGLRKFQYANEVKYLVKIEKMPRVSEIGAKSEAESYQIDID